MQINYYCPFCRESTKHHIKGHVDEGPEETKSELQCTKCLGEKITVAHETGKLPLFDSKRVQNITEEERGKKEVRFCGHCIKDCWGREKPNPETKGTAIFKCFTCEKISIVPPQKKVDELDKSDAE